MEFARQPTNQLSPLVGTSASVAISNPSRVSEGNGTSLQKISSDTIIGCLLGTAVGDSLALPFEGLSVRRQAKFVSGLYKHGLLFGKGMISDDTEHAVMLVQSLIASKDLTGFKHDFARRLKHWAIMLPAGIGLGTLRSSLKLWMGFGPDNSGVNSAGNGPCMRSPILGVMFGSDPHKLLTYVEASSRITHTDPRATSGALVVAVAAHVSATSENVSIEEYLTEAKRMLVLNGDAELTPLLERTARSVEAGESTSDFAVSLGLHRGVSGFVLHTVPVVVHSWLRSPNNFREAITQTIRCGGDTDTTSAIVGGIVGARVKENGIPVEWVDGIWEPAFGPIFLRRLGSILAQTQNYQIASIPPQVSVGKRLARNALFLGVVLSHGFRRLAPPY